MNRFCKFHFVFLLMAFPLASATAMVSESNDSQPKHRILERNHLSEFGVINRKVIPAFSTLSKELLEKWANISIPERHPTPLKQLDLSRHGYGVVWIKDESDLRSNPTGTMKDRAALSYAKFYRNFAQTLKSQSVSSPELKNIPVPRLSLLTSGNAGNALATCLEKFDLPPPKLLISHSAYIDYQEKFETMRADIYSADLSKGELTSELIKEFTQNPDGIDLTSTRALETQAQLYSGLVHEVFKHSPDEIYVPYGSGDLFANFLTWQGRIITDAADGARPSKLDPEARIERISAAHIFAAEPISPHSIADKLTAPHKPFVHFKESDIREAVRMGLTGRQTQKVSVEEELILKAHQILQEEGVCAEPSGAASLALYLKRYQNQAIDPSKKVIIINTGFGTITRPPNTLF